MRRKHRKHLWGLQWVFLRDNPEAQLLSKNTQNLFDFASSKIEDRSVSDLDEFPDIPLDLTTAFERRILKISSSIRDTYKLVKTQDIPYDTFRFPRIQTGDISEAEFPPVQHFSDIQSTGKKEKPGTVEIRKLSLPPKKAPKQELNEENTSFNRRKNYGKWYLPPSRWNQCLSKFISTAKTSKVRTLIRKPIIS